MRNIIDCFSSYDSSTWSTNLDKLDLGLKLAIEILLPALLLGVWGSCLPTSNIPIGDTVNLPPYSYMDILSPYSSHSAVLSSSIALTSTPITYNHPLLSNFDPIYLLRMTILSLISPLSLDVIFNCVRPILFQVLQRFKVVLQSRKRADHSTRVQLREKIKEGRVLQRHSYDLYLPPSKESNDATDDSNIKCLLFFPGFGIHHSAYADVASLISQYGIPVAVVSLEPLRLAHAKLGGSIQDVRRILKYAGRDVVKYYKQNDNNNVNEVTVDEKDNESVILEWDVGGHSMGGYNSLQLAPVLQQSDDEQLTIKLSQNNGSISSRIGSQIIVWGAGNLVDSVPNLQTLNSSDESTFRVLILLGSNDDLAKFTSHRQKRDLLRKLPRRSKMQTIKGANHSGFASYDEASKKSSTFLLNGIRDITLKSQQEETARRTADFLLNQ